MFKTAQRIATSCVFATVLLSGCGGGGSGGSTGGPPLSGAPTPSPTPTPPPAPPPTSDNGTGTISTYAPFGVTEDTEMSTIGWINEGGATRWLEANEIALAWRAGSRTFAATFPVLGSGQVVDDPANLARSAGYLADSAGQRIAATHFYIPGAPGAVSALSLVGSFAAPDRKSPPSGTFVYFAKAAVPPSVTGRVTYRIPELYTDGTRVSLAAVTVDFDAGTVTGKLSITYTDAWGPYPETFYEIEGGRYDRTTGRITGTFQMPGSGFEGSLRGQVLGAQGQVAGIVARGATIDPYERKWRESWHIAGFVRDP